VEPIAGAGSHSYRATTGLATPFSGLDPVALDEIAASVKEQKVQRFFE
jgi:hypothetical protein